jgi:hypothetical protein
MRIITHDIPPAPPPQSETRDLRPIRSPGGAFGMLIAQLTGLVLLICPTLFLCMAASQIALPPSESHTISLETAPWVSVVLALLIYIPLHEGVHMLFQPGMGRSPNSVLLFMPAKLRIGVYYEGSMSRRRWLMMRLAPFVLLTLVPISFLALIQNLPFISFARTMMEVITIVNGVGSGADVAASVLVFFQVPASATMVFQAGRAYWMPAAEKQT